MKINIKVVRKWVRDYTRYPVGMEMGQQFDTH